MDPDHKKTDFDIFDSAKGFYCVKQTAGLQSQLIDQEFLVSNMQVLPSLYVKVCAQCMLLKMETTFSIQKIRTAFVWNGVN